METARTGGRLVRTLSRGRAVRRSWGFVLLAVLLVTGSATVRVGTPPAAIARSAAQVPAGGPADLLMRPDVLDVRQQQLASTARAVRLNSRSNIDSRRSGRRWASGVYLPGSNPRNAAAFGAWRGRPVDVVVDWSARGSWQQIVEPGWLYEAWKGTPYTKVFGVAPIPEGGGSTLSSCAAGAYDGYWRRFATNITAAGLGRGTVIRLGWEFNGDWYRWTARSPAAFVGCWRRIVSTVRPLAPRLVWDWSVNRGLNSGLADATRAYPGDGYVDIVGVDSYDQYPGATSEAGWQRQYAGAYGLKFWADFATAHGKRLSVPEWGLYPSRGADSGGDNPFYMVKMQGFFASLGDRLAYEAYFDESAGYYRGAIFAPTQNPAAAAEYRRLAAG